MKTRKIVIRKETLRALDETALAAAQGASALCLNSRLASCDSQCACHFQTSGG